MKFQTSPSPNVDSTTPRRGNNPSNWMRNQVQWIRRQIKDPNTTIIDIGPKGTKPASPYYQKELDMLKKWLGY